MVVAGLLVACAGPTEEDRAAGTSLTETEAAPEAETRAAPEVETEATPEAAPEAEPEAEREGAPSPTVHTRVSFDLRSMPHRGPYDVDQSAVTGRVQLLIERMREAAGAPEPRFGYQPGISVFRAEFFGSPAEALAQCRRAIAEVAPPPPADRPLPRRARLRDVEATPCAQIDDDETP